ncbi:MAG: caspase family protein [Candidatus Pacebacteria bacterium]|nr:caspase family protein [Candidatus Paceibacterota bacterium]
MKKLLSLTIVFCCVLAMPVVAGMKSNSANDNASQNNRSDLFRPMHATNIKIAKKKVLSPDIIREIKSRPETPPGRDRNEEVPVEEPVEANAATGVLGELLVEGANKYAVVIGICDYPDRRMDICLSDGDSYNMYKALTELYGYKAENIYWFRDKGGSININGDEISYEIPTHQNIKNAVIDIKAKVGSNDKNDEVVFFFSGHGTNGIVADGIVAGEDDGEYIDEGIVVYDSDGKRDGDRSSKLDFIWDGELRNWFDGFATDRIIFIFDTCRAGGMKDLDGDGRIIVMSSEEDQYSYVYSYGEFGEGMFSHYFVNEGMLQDLADTYDNVLNTEDVTIEEAFDYAKENIPLYLTGEQTPTVNDFFTDDLLLGYYSPTS